MSTDFRELFEKHINHLIFNDPRNVPSKNYNCLGYSFNDARERVLLRGRVDFSTSYTDKDSGCFDNYGRADGDYGPTLSPKDKVLLYCLIFSKSHFDEISQVLRKQKSSVESLFSPDCKTLIIDFGCGPGTVCFAIADLFKGKTFDYIGIDIAPEMQQKANELFIAAQAEQLINKDCTAKFIPSWEDFSESAIAPKTKIFLSSSFFFASNFLTENDLKSLALFIKNLTESNKTTEIELLYTNSTYDYARKNYEKFVEFMNIKSKPESLGNFMYEIISFKKVTE